MITLKNTPHENIVAFELNGEIDTAGMSATIATIKSRIKKLGKVRLYADIKSMDGWDSFEDFTDTIKEKFAIIGEIGNIEKYAIVSDKSWLKASGKFGDFIFPTMDIKVFEPTDAELAMSWLQLPTREELHGLQLIDLNDSNLLAFSIDGRLTKTDMDLVNEKIELQLLKQPKLRMYIEFVNLSGMSLQALWEDLKAEIKYYNKFERVAIVAEKSWVEPLTKLSNFLNSKTKIKYFRLAQKEEAVEWLNY